MLVWYAQELLSSCVVACVRMVLGGLGAQVAEATVHRLVGHTRLGVSLMVAQMQLSKAGATALLHEDWNLVEVTRAAVTVLDPLDGPEPRHYGIAAFVSAWEVAGREALVIEAAPLTP